ncbi:MULTISPECIES: ABC transporter permease [unclassified Marinovum]|uniref:ABC transporter permease n=1 Tax=unclassified Marinovum TaxID=2647166 RepID=UPI003EDC7645
MTVTTDVNVTTAPRRLWSPSNFTWATLSFAGGIGLWWLATVAGFSELPSPLVVVRRMIELAIDGQLWEDMFASLHRVMIGFVLGSVIAVPTGFLMGWYRVARAVIDPWVQFFRVIPPLAIIPLAIVTMGIDETPKIFVIFLAAFLSAVVSTYQGVVSVDKTYINAARVLGANDRVIFMQVIIPASTPFILVGFRIGLGSAWATVVAAELIAAQSGLGFRMQQAQLYYDLPTIFVSLVAIGVLGLIMDRIVVWAEERLTHWQERV